MCSHSTKEFLRKACLLLDDETGAKKNPARKKTRTRNSANQYFFFSCDSPQTGPNQPLTDTQFRVLCRRGAAALVSANIGAS